MSLKAGFKRHITALAFKEVGKLERTIFVLNYLLDRSLQRRNLRGLNKGEAIWGAARAINAGQDGDVYDRNLTFRAKGEEISDEYLSHVSPLGWQHVNLLGRYEFDLAQAYPLQPA